MGRYPFGVELFHLLPHAGLSRRFLKYSNRSDTPRSCPTSDHRWSATQARLLAPQRVVDNGSSHRGKASIERMTKAWPTARLVHLPVQIFFSILQRKVLTPNDLTDLDALTERVLAFQDRYNTTATPFDWKFTRADLDRLLERIAAHEPAPAPATTTAA